MNKIQNSDEADDIVQQTLLLAFRHLDQFRFEAGFATWLFQIALNVIRGRSRRPGFSRVVTLDPRTLENLDVRDTRQSPLAALEKNETRIRIRRAVSELPDKYRSVIHLRDFDGMSIEETAKSLRLTRPAVKSRHRRARLKLLTLLKSGQPLTQGRLQILTH